MGNLRFRGVRLAIAERTLLEGVDLDARPGELLAIVGANGVGKTTLLRAAAGFLPVAAGSVLAGGIDVRTLSHQERAREITLIGDDLETPHGMSVREVVLTGRFAHRAWWDWLTGDADLFATDAALARVALTEFAERAFDTLSSGERQRAWLALALAQDAQTFLLDEPTSHLDARYALEILSLLRDLARDGRAIVAVLHDLNEAAAFADRIAVLGDGRLLACAPPDDALEPALLEHAFGVAFDTFYVDGGTRVVARAPHSMLRDPKAT
jgi:ABC-type cobalamin/Fe3+-siderophores transport system ATPase subunit